MTTDWPPTDPATARDARRLAHILACPHEKCRTTRRCRLRWTSTRRCPARTHPPDEPAATTLLARTTLELHRIAFEEDDGSRTDPLDHAEQQRRIAVAFERARSGCREAQALPPCGGG